MSGMRAPRAELRRGAWSSAALLIAALISAALLARAAAGDARQQQQPKRPRPSRSLLAPGCRVFVPGACAMRHSDGPSAVPYCHTGDGLPRACAFDTQPLAQCPLYAGGRFAQIEGPGKLAGKACEAPFMRTRKRPPPACGPACCRGDLPGDFTKNATFQPTDAGCLYHEYNHRQVMECLAGSRLVIAGDSIMRQLFNAGVALFRGQEVAIDYNRHSHARYRICDAADSLALSSFVPARWEVPLPEIGQLFGPSADAQPDDSGCLPEARLQIDYLWAPRYSDLTSQLAAYHRDAAAAADAQQQQQQQPKQQHQIQRRRQQQQQGQQQQQQQQQRQRQRRSYVVFAGFWEDQPHVAEAFLATLDEVRAAAESLIVVSVPRTRLWGDVKANAAARNNATRAWAAQRSPEAGGNVLWLDFDALAHAPNAPPALGSLNWHYQCFLDHKHTEEAMQEVGGTQGAWHWPGLPEHIYPSVWTDDAAACSDGMDRAVWQVLLNLLCSPRAPQPARFPPGRRALAGALACCRSGPACPLVTREGSG